MDLILSSIGLGAGKGVRGQNVWISLGTETRLKGIIQTVKWNLTVAKPSDSFSSVQSLSHVRFFATPWLQHTRPPCLSPTPGVHSNSRLSSWWCHPAISSSVVPFTSRPQSLPASQSIPMSQLFAWGGQSTGVSALASFLPKNTQDWSPLEWTGWISLQSKGLSTVFSNTTVQKHQVYLLKTLQLSEIKAIQNTG